MIIVSGLSRHDADQFFCCFQHLRLIGDVSFYGEIALVFIFLAYVEPFSGSGFSTPGTGCRRARSDPIAASTAIDYVGISDVVRLRRSRMSKGTSVSMKTNVFYLRLVSRSEHRTANAGMTTQMVSAKVARWAAGLRPSYSPG